MVNLKGEAKKQSVQLASSLLSITVLVVDDDSTSLSIVSALLKSWKYKVSTVRNSIDALSTLRVQTNIDLVVTDLHMPGMDGIELQKQIQQEFQLPVVIMSSDDDESIIYNSLRCGAAYYMIKPISPAELKNLWQYTVGSRKGKSVVTVAENPVPVLSPSPIPSIHIFDDINSSSSSAVHENKDKTVRNDCKRKFMSDPPNDNDNDNNNDEQNTQLVVIATKKAKVVWTNSLHNRFLQAIRYLGLDKAVPKNILEFMNVPGLKRENVASHLQKYRIFLKRVAQTGFFTSKGGISERVLRSSFATGHASLLLKNHLDSDLYPQFMDRYNYPLNPSTALFLQQQSEAMANGYVASSSKTVKHPPGCGPQSVIMSHLYGHGQQSTVVGNPNPNPNRNPNSHYIQPPPNRSAPGTLNWTAYGNGGRSGYMSFANPVTAPPTPAPSTSTYIVTSNVNGGSSRSNYGIKPNNVAPAYAGIRINTNSDIPRTSSQISSKNGDHQQQKGFINNNKNSFIMTTATTIAPPGTNWTNAFGYDSGPQEKYGRFGLNIGGSTKKHIQFQPSGNQNQNSMNLIANDLSSFDLNNSNAYQKDRNFDFSKSNIHSDTLLDPNYSNDFSFFQKGVNEGHAGDNKNNPPNLPLLLNAPSWKGNQYPNGTLVKITTSPEGSNHRVPDPNLHKNQGESSTNMVGSSKNMASLSSQDWADDSFMDSLINSHPYE